VRRELLGERIELLVDAQAQGRTIPAHACQRDPKVGRNAIRPAGNQPAQIVRVAHARLPDLLTSYRQLATRDALKGVQHVIVQHLELLAAFLVTSLCHGLPALGLQGRRRGLVGLCRGPEEYACGQGCYQGEHDYHRAAAENQNGADRADVLPRARHPGNSDRSDRPGRDPPGGEEGTRDADSADRPEHPAARRGRLSCGKRPADDDGARDSNGYICQHPPGRHVISAERGSEQNRRPHRGEQVADQDNGRQTRDAVHHRHPQPDDELPRPEECRSADDRASSLLADGPRERHCC
jgi:hypothetical protein